MTNQIAKLTNARITHNDDHNKQSDDEEANSDPTHVSETQQPEEDQPDNEDDELDNVVGPFTVDVMNFQLPKNFALPMTLTLYDGLNDSKKYVKKFCSIMIVNGAFDPILCHCFPTFLDGHALD
ncbi:Putative gag protein [Arachis hypogaea]|nr:Putative gag protein [Arachis hypogaea]